jgi:hypothetical protein
MSFVISQDPNVKFDDTNIVPYWPLYKEGSIEMFFNSTEDGLPDINIRATDSDLVDRCK